MSVLALAAVALVPGCAGSRTSSAVALTVSAAASAQNALNELAPAYQHSRPDLKIIFNFGGSGILEQQIDSGAPVDVFLSASPKPMDMLADKGLLAPGTRRDLLQNQVVLIAPQGSTAPNSFQELAGSQVKLIALGDPGSVPAGDYGRQVLESLQVWPAVQSKLVLAQDVLQVLSYVVSGNADAGIVYATDAGESGKVRVAATAPPGSHKPVVYPVAVIKTSRNIAAARAFIGFLSGTEARAVFLRHGFTAVSP